jgi:hypothetical protein
LRLLLLLLLLLLSLLLLLLLLLLWLWLRQLLFMLLLLLLLLLLLWLLPNLSRELQCLHEGFAHCHMEPCRCVVQQLLTRLHPRAMRVQRKQRVHRQKRGKLPLRLLMCERNILTASVCGSCQLLLHCCYVVGSLPGSACVDRQYECQLLLGPERPRSRWRPNVPRDRHRDHVPVRRIAPVKHGMKMQSKCSQS